MFNVKDTNNPCYECEDRAVGCHATCEKYINWRKEYDKLKKVYKKQKKQRTDGYY